MQKATRQLRIGRLIRQPEIGRSESEIETGRQDADDGVSAPIERQRLAQHIPVATEAPLPHSVREDSYSWGPWLVIARLKCTSDESIDSQHRKEIRGCLGREHAFRLASSGHDGATAGVGGDPLANLILLVVLVIRIGEFALRKLLLRRAFKKVIEPFWRSVWKAAQQGRIHNGKYRRATANAERQSDDRNQREAGLLRECADGVTQILQQFVHLSSLLLLVSQGDQRVDFRGASRGNQASYESNHDQNY